ncbi:MAG: hypothetical protein M1495_20705 [Bacteroidetes bacterium]|nr:hypothetical protein [Bacteroidota bacterium]
MTDKKQTGENPSNDFSEVDRELFLKIKSVQSLPDDVVYEFLKSKGKLHSTDFKSKILRND